MNIRPVIAGNWKMNLGPGDVSAFFREFRPTFSPGETAEILLFPTSLSLASALSSLPEGRRIGLGVQNIHWEASGAYTGEISAPMAAEAGATHALIGHSERRQLFGENDAEVALKTASALAAGLTPVVCVGETLDERRAGRLTEVLHRQIKAVLPVFASHEGARVMLAYEPVWAIGTGETATPADASEAHLFLRERLAEGLGHARGEEIPILYGGSVKPGNAGELIRAPGVNGVLVGGASLDPGSFSAIAEAGAEAGFRG